VVDAAVHVVIETGDLPEVCRPRFVKILIDDTDYGFPPFGTTQRIPGNGTWTFQLVPSSLRAPPASVQASLGTRPELRGSDSRVALNP